MKRVAAVFMAAIAACAAAADPPVKDATWPQPTQASKPWTRWWWPGSAVDPGELTRELEEFAAAGIGGVEITPIYGARGAEARDISYLSPRWVEMLAHVTREARRLGLGVDMATGTGWPFGGPQVDVADGSSSLQLVDGRLTGKPTAMKVKRAAPGGEGLVLDPYSTAALDHYLQPFSRALSSLPRGALRSQFHDSFEYYGASWSTTLPERFRAMHGYDIQQFAAELAGSKPLDADTLGRVKGDYRRTLAAMHLDYLRHWAQWAHARGWRVRNQAHGAPGRLLDLYGVSDIPETESFGATVLPIPGLRQAPDDIREDPDPPVNLIGRFASSAAHVNGRPRVSSETLTWLRENFHESPAQAKPQIDRLFVAGINHVFYHGTTYSPRDADWPGWFFYAATQLNPRNPLWKDFGALHAYVARVQSVLQAGSADNDVLFYWPEADEQDDVFPVSGELMRQHGMHENEWLVHSVAGRRARELIEAGYSLDFISDAQLQSLRAHRGKIVAPGGRYRLLCVPAMRRMPVETLAALVRLQRAGAQIQFDALPEDVPGLGRLGQRRTRWRQLLREIGPARAVSAAWPDAPGVTREPAAQLGLWFTRRARADGFDYFLVNAGPRDFAGWLPLATAGASATLMDPLNGDVGTAATRQGADGRLGVYLQVASGGSVVLRTASKRAALPGLAWRYTEPRGEGVTLEGRWQVEFLQGGPSLPPPAEFTRLTTWTEWSEAARSFSGTARYRLEFQAPAVAADDWLLDLGEVRETARVTLNGRFLGTLWSLPASLRVGAALRPGANRLEIEVTNLPANRIRDLELRRADWKVMKDINLASLRYQALDAAAWRPQPSGLLGPVRLMPLGVSTAPSRATMP